MIIVKNNAIITGKLAAGREELNRGFFTCRDGNKYALDDNGTVIEYSPLAIVDVNGDVESPDTPRLLRLLSSGDWVWANVYNKYGQYNFDGMRWVKATCIHCGHIPVEIGCVCADCIWQMHELDEPAQEEIWHDDDAEIGCKICYSVDKDLDADGWCDDCQNIDLEAAEDARIERLERAQEY